MDRYNFVYKGYELILEGIDRGDGIVEVHQVYLDVIVAEVEITDLLGEDLITQIETEYNEENR